VIDDESGESIEPMGEVPLEEWVNQNWRVVCGWRREVDSRDEGKYTERNDLLFLEKMMWKDERRVWPMKSECCEEAERWWGYADMKVGWL